jgi:hypothetical protein
MKEGKGKAAKKAMKFAERRAKAEKWVAEYDGTIYGRDIIKAYRKKFAVDRMKAVAELQMLGVSLTKDQIDREKAAVKAYQKLQKAEKAKKKGFVNRRKYRKRISYFMKIRMILLGFSRIVYSHGSVLWVSDAACGA